MLFSFLVLPPQFVALFGSTTLGLGYSLVAAEAILAPAIPSVSARAGGIFLPLVKALCIACGSKADDGTEKKIGAWLMLTCFQVGAAPFTFPSPPGPEILHCTVL